MIEKLLPYRANIMAFMGVLAVSGIGAASMGALYIRAQNQRIDMQAERITDLTRVNTAWAKHANEMDRLRSVEQQNVLLLQDKLGLIQQQNDHAAAQLKQLESTNAEVKEYLARPIPADLRRLLERQ